MPEDRFGEIAGASVVQQEGVPADGLRQADAPERWRAPPAAAGDPDLLPIRKLLAHVVQQEIGIGPDELEGLRLVVGIAAGDELRRMAARAAEIVEDLLATERLGKARLSPRRHGEVSGVEGNEVEHRVRSFCRSETRLLAGRHGKAFCLRRGAVAVRPVGVGGGDADIGGESVGALLPHGGILRLPAETAEHRLAGPGIARQRGAAADPVAIGVVRIGKRQDIGLVDRLDQAEPDHRLGHARRERRRRIERPVGEVGYGIARSAQRNGLTVGEGEGLLRVADLQMTLGCKAGHGAILKLGTVNRIRKVADLMCFDQPPFLVVARRARQAEEHRSRIGGAFGRASAPVLQVAALAGAGIVERTEPVGRLGRGGRGNPELAEERIAELEALFLLEGEIGRELRETVGIDGRDRGRCTPDIASKVSALEKSSVGRVTASTRARSLLSRSVRSVGRPSPARAGRAVESA